ncbi:DUF2110 family protein [Methanohalobium sp.]|uniref:DUF2110 family protein n=1 Tax=Methanohalobium sp. TaxID=2837493 RepID=UPI0025D01409|nr:DUF2110 family protein [Methanohalobium sp.]
MRSVILLLQIYRNTERAIHSIKNMIYNDLKELEVSVDVSATPEGWVQVDLSGEDEEFSANYLLSEYKTPVDKVEPGKEYKGYIQSIKSDRILVNVGIELSIPQSHLKPLGTGNVEQIASRFGIIPYLPVSVDVTDNSEYPKARFTKKQIDMWWDWKKSSTDRVIANSATRSELKSAIKKKGHGKDIYGIERLGVMEHAIVCREDTDGPGIVAEIGKLLISDLGVVVGNG